MSPSTPVPRTVVERKAHLEVLDGMRGVAACIVVVHHLGGVLVLPLLATRGYLAVDFFFMLSGLVLAYAYGERLRDGMPARTFALLRVVRLYPMIVFGMAVGTVVAFYTFRVDPPTHADMIVAVTLGTLGLPVVFASSLPPELFPLDGPLWSIFFELVANLLLIFVARRRYVASWVVVIALAGAVALFAAGRIEHEMGIGSRLVDWPWGFARVGFSFFVGVALLRCRKWMPLRVPGLAVVAVVAAFFIPRFIAHNVIVDLIIVMVVFPWAISILSLIEPPLRWRSACASSGEISYPVYALHYPFVLAIGATPALHALSIGGRTGVALGATASMLALAWVVSRLYDRPVRGRLTRLLFRPAGLQATRTPAGH